MGPLTFSKEKSVHALPREWLLLARIDDLCLKERARAEEAVLTVTPTAPPAPSRFLSLHRLCSAQSPNIAADWLGRSECRSGAASANMSIVKTALSFHRALAATHRIRFRSRNSFLKVGWDVCITVSFLLNLLITSVQLVGHCAKRSRPP